MNRIYFKALMLLTIFVSCSSAEIRTKYPVDLYGYIKLDAAYDTARTDNGNYARWVNSESTNKKDSQFNMTANQTRLGFKFSGPAETGNIKISGKIEVDFYGGGGAENKGNIMMRHAYLQMDWLDSDLSLLAGQTSDVVSPLFPNTINLTVGWWAGNYGYRNPQLRLTKGIPVKGGKLLIQGAFVRTIGDANIFGPGDSGEDAGFPAIQARVAYLAANKTTIGISGHWGTEEYDFNNKGEFNDYKTWSANLDLLVPISGKVIMKSELWAGTNMDQYLGGIGQGINTSSTTTINSSGGWLTFSIGPFDKCSYEIGATVDDPDDNNLSNNNDKTSNMSYFANVWYAVTESVKMGVELSNWRTEYNKIEPGDSIRLQYSLVYEF